MSRARGGRIIAAMHSMSFTDPTVSGGPGGASTAVVHGACATDAEVRAVVWRLVGGSVAAAGLSLGAAFLLAALAAGERPDGGMVVPLGGVFLAAGLLSAALALLGVRRGRRRAAAERAARTAQATVVVVEARLRLGSRVGALHPLRLVVRWADGGDAARTLWVPATTEVRPGQRMHVRHAPADRGNFAPASAS